MRSGHPTSTSRNSLRLSSLFAFLAIGFFALAFTMGCGKKTDAELGTSMQVIDASKLRPAFSSADEGSKAMVENVMMGIQGSDYRTAMANLDKLSASSSITEPQKAVVNDVKAQVDKKLATTAPAAGQ